MKYLIASCTKQSPSKTFPSENPFPLMESFKKLDKIYHIVKDNIEIGYRVEFENKEGLSKMYNIFIEDAIKQGYDRIIFAHDDVCILDMFMCEKLEEAFKTYDVIGLAGSVKFGLKSPVCWHNSPREGWSGAVEHPAVNGDPDSGWNTVGYGPSPRRVAVIDGLFIAVNLKKLGNVRFREKFLFHFYDIGFSLDCNTAGLKVGVTNIHVSHNSHGSYSSTEWKRAEQDFIKEFAK